MAAHITFGRICEVYHKELENTIYQICACRDEEWEMIRTRKDGSIAAYIQEMGDHIRRQENQQIIHMKRIKKLVRRNNELEEEIKSTRDGYEEEIDTLLEKNDDLIKKIGVFMGDPAPGGEDDDSTCPENYIIVDDTDSDPDDSDDDYEDEAGADIMESSTDQNF